MLTASRRSVINRRVSFLTEPPDPVAGAQVSGRVLCDAAGVGGDAVEDSGTSGRQPRMADEVEAGKGGDAAPVCQRTVACEHRHVEPVEVWPEAGGPDDGADTLDPAVEH